MRKNRIKRLLNYSFSSIVLKYDYYLEGKPIKRFKSNEDNFLDILFRLNNERFLIRGEQGLHIWDSKKNILKFIQKNALFCFKLDSERYVTADHQGPINVWNVKTFQREMTFDVPVYHLTVFDGKIYASLTNGFLCLIDKDEMYFYDFLNSNTNFFVLSENVIICYSWQSLHIYNLKEEKFIFSQYESQFMIQEIKRISDERFVLIYIDYIEFWNTKGLEFQIQSRDIIYDFEFVEPYSIVSDGYYLIIRKFTEIIKIIENNFKTMRLTVLPNGKLICGTEMTHHKILDLETLSYEKEIVTEKDICGNLFFKILDNNNLVSITNKKEIIIWK